MKRLSFGSRIAIAAGLILAASAVFASTPAAQVLFGPGQPVTLTGAGPAGSNTAEVIIDTVATKTTGKLLSVRNSGVEKFSIDKDGLASPAIASATSTVTTGNVFSIADTSASQTTATGLAVTQSGTTTGYTGSFVNFTGSSTTGTGNLLALTCVNTTAGACESVTSNSATTSATGVLALSATALTTGSAVVIKGGSEANVTTAGRYLSVQDSAGNEQFSVGVDGHQVFAQATVPVVTNTGGSGPSCVGCTDTNGKLVVTTAANTNVITLTFHTSATPRGCVITPADANTAVDLKAAGGGVVAVAAGTFTVSSPSANWAANQKNIYYSCFF